jgi:hypothetical protein
MLAAISKKKTIADYLINTFAYTVALLCVALGWPAFDLVIFKSKSDAT